METEMNFKQRWANHEHKQGVVMEQGRAHSNTEQMYKDVYTGIDGSLETTLFRNPAWRVVQCCQGHMQNSLVDSVRQREDSPYANQLRQRTAVHSFR